MQGTEMILGLSFELLIRILLIIFVFVKVNGKDRHRRGTFAKLQSKGNDTIELKFGISSKPRKTRQLSKKKGTRARRHHHGETYTMKLKLHQTKHKMRIIKLQPAIKVFIEANIIVLKVIIYLNAIIYGIK